MRYVDGFVVPVPTGGRQAYLEMAEKVAPMFKEHGATRVVELSRMLSGSPESVTAREHAAELLRTAAADR